MWNRSLLLVPQVVALFACETDSEPELSSEPDSHVADVDGSVPQDADSSLPEVPVCSPPATMGPCPPGLTCVSGACVVDVDPEDPKDQGASLAEWEQVWRALDMSYASFVAKPEVDWDAVRSSVSERMMSALTRMEAKDAVARGVLSLGDGHTAITSQYLSQHALFVAGLPYSTLGACSILGEDRRVLVKSVLEGNRTGLRVGDEILAIDDRPVDYLMHDINGQPASYFPSSTKAHLDAQLAQNVLARITGREETVTIRRDGVVVDLPIVMQGVEEFVECDARIHSDEADLLVGDEIRTARFEGVGPDGGDVSYIDIRLFGSSTPTGGVTLEPALSDLRAALAAAESATGIIVDLRGNQGGFPLLYLELAGAVLGDDRPLFRCHSRGTASRTDLKDPFEQRAIPGSVDLSQKSVVVLADAQSFSAGDFAVVSLAHGDNVTVLGAPTAGGFSSVASVPVNSDVELRRSILACSTLDGTWLEGSPPLPDMEVWPTAEDLVRGVDTALARAFQQLADAGE